ncbi:hypothetical protein Phum_PHUM462060 [Pediculus humanus corporis]|uniref:Prohormone-1 n=1 Tax=Pediculus humanus subsp. corporis TaxID=121224 RepID=E0VVD1_PEDHC|nr:uncharacterized protein Phum_PHUM462060 [Pediculus humanus corporis]EEB17337.1 hypothetical protein Phum_PHUM462060 [Pediculus humanus corporis]
MNQQIVCTRFKILIVAVLLALAVGGSKGKTIDTSSSEQESIYPKNQLEFGSRNSLVDDRPRDLQIFKYLLTNEILNRQQNLYDWDAEQQRKRSYWKQCAFNAVSCFGKK